MRNFVPLRRIRWPAAALAAAMLFLLLASCTSGSLEPEDNLQELKDSQKESDEPPDGLEDGDTDVGESDQDAMGDDEDGVDDDDQPYPDPEDSVPSRSDRLTPIPQQEKELETVSKPQDIPVVGEVPAELMDAIMKDLSEQTGANSEDIQVIRAEYTIWPDGSLGCAKPGEMYTQAEVPGYWVELQINGDSYDYRAAESGYFFICEQKLPVVRPLTGGTPEK